MIDRSEQMLMASIVGDATPAYATEDARPQYRTAWIGRGEYSFAAIPRNQIPAATPVPKRDAPGV